MNILLVEDDNLMAEFVKRVLKSENHFVSVAYDGIQGFKKAQASSYDAIILDVLLPSKDGLSICRDLRRLKIMTPILFLTSQYDEKSRVDGLDAGADDYLVKPFSYKELSARLRAITRRPSVVIQSSLVVGDLTLNPEGHSVTRQGRALSLRPKEYDLLEYMMRNPGIALPKHVLLRNVWKIRSESASNRLEVYIRHLRQKVDHPFKRKLIHTVRGVGYKITA